MPSSTHQDSVRRLAEQIEAAQQGSQEALGWLLEKYRQPLLRLARAQLAGQLQAKGGGSDLVQETFLEAQRIFDRFHGATGADLLAWLQAILANKAATFSRHFRHTSKRRIAREVSLDGAPEGVQEPIADDPAPGSALLQAEQFQVLDKALEQLPEHYRQVLRWRQWEELSFEEIGRRLDRSPDAARMLWWRAIERLHKEIDPSP